MLLQVFIHFQRIIKDFSFHLQIPTITILIQLNRATVSLRIEHNPISVALERGLNASGQANIQPASDRVTDIGLCSIRRRQLLNELNSKQAQFMI